MTEALATGDRGRVIDALRPELDWAEHPTVLVVEDVLSGRRGRVRRGGYASRQAAAAARDALLDQSREGYEDLDERVIMISRQHVRTRHITMEGPPKTRASRRTIALDATTVRLLQAHVAAKRRSGLRLGDRWVDSGCQGLEPRTRGLRVRCCPCWTVHIVLTVPSDAGPSELWAQPVPWRPSTP